MKRSSFLSSPGAWIRPHRLYQSPAEYGCAVIEVGKRSIWVRIGIWFARRFT